MRRQAWCLVPVKRLGAAKQRLDAVLSPDQRMELARLMATDVIRAARGAACLKGVAVVTADEDVAAFARREGAYVIREPEGGGLNAALGHASAELAGRGVATILVLPGDVPLVTADDIAAMIDGHDESPSVTVARAICDGGSNALAVTPPGAIGFRFGEDSFERHCLAARAAGIEPHALLLPRLAVDIDRPADLDAMLTQESQTLAAAFLSSIAASHARVSHET